MEWQHSEPPCWLASFAGAVGFRVVVGVVGKAAGAASPCALGAAGGRVRHVRVDESGAQELVGEALRMARRES